MSFALRHQIADGIQNKKRIRFVENVLNELMVEVPGGTFMMGDSVLAAPVHEVSLKGFKIAKFETPKILWDVVMGGAQPPEEDISEVLANADPTVYTSWNTAQNFLDRINEMLGLEKAKERYRLPSEAQWEYAARGGEKGASDEFRYAGSNKLISVGWYRHSEFWKIGPDHDSTYRIMRSGLLKPNQLGLYDMIGNVQEWCEDSWHDSYEGAPADGSSWSDSNINSKVIRGASFWDFDSTRCTVASRITKNNNDGRHQFRIALSSY